MRGSVADKILVPAMLRQLVHLTETVSKVSVGGVWGGVAILNGVIRGGAYSKWGHTLHSPCPSVKGFPNL